MVSSINYTTLLLHSKNLQYLAHMENDWTNISSFISMKYLIQIKHIQLGKVSRNCYVIYNEHAPLVKNNSVVSTTLLDAMTNNFVTTEKTFDSLCGYSLQLNRWLLKPIGAWPVFTSTSRCDRIISFVLVTLCYGLVLFTVIPCILHLIFEDETVYAKIEIFGALSHWFIGGLNYTNLLLRSRDIHYCVCRMQTDWKAVRKPEDLRVMMKHAKIGRLVAAVCTVFMQSSILMYCAGKAVTKETVIIGNQTKVIRMLPCAVYKNLIPVHTSPTYGIVLATQFLSGVIVNSSAVGAISIGAVFAAHACGQLTILMTSINEFLNRPKDRKDNDGFNDIGEIVDYHLKVLSFIAGIENVMTEFCFLELLKSRLDISMLGYYIVTDLANDNVRSAVTYFIIMVSMSFNIFTVCYIGDTITKQCRKIGDVVYATNWYYLSNKDMLNLILIISRANSVVKITAGKMTHMCLYTFSDVIKLTFAYFNLLREVA
ncbi:odorant receptor 4-like [Frieseomelitta varia]|uniref:odorant receptor 4-like n=1 Tax=Frieseomelitta varia TaxID=561572 RepID=UPI001CB6AB5F|nr:odorant receptor 4-like [Frieseomelitta varia]